MSCVLTFLLICARADASGALKINTATRHSQTNPAVAANGNIAVVAWQSDANYRTEVLAAISSDGGKTFGPEILIAGADGREHREPAAAVAPDGKIFVAWQALTDDKDYDILLASAGPDGKFGAPVRVNSEKNGNQIFPDVASASDGSAHVVWMDNRENPSFYHIYTARSADGGKTFSAGLKISSKDGVNLWPAIRADGARVAAAWQGPGGKGNDILVSESNDGGKTFREAASPPGDKGQHRESPRIGFADGALELIWTERRGKKCPVLDPWYRCSPFDYDIYLSRAKSGLDFSEPIRVNSERAGHQIRPDIAALPGSETAAAWFDGRSIADFDIYFSLGKKGKFAPELQVNPAERADARNVRLAAAGGSLLIVWQDDSEGNYEIYCFSTPLESLR